MGQVIALKKDFAPKIREKLVKLITEYGSTLQLELALLYDIGLHLVKLCYLAEGDGVLSPYVYDDLENLKTIFEQLESYPMVYVPNLYLLADRLAKEGKVGFETAVTTTIAKCAPVAKKFAEEFYDEKHEYLLPVWKFCRLFKLDYVVGQRESVDTLRSELQQTILPQLTHLMDKLLSELDMYVSCATTSAKTPLLQFWEQHKRTLPTWYVGFQVIALLQPSSAAAERVFSQLRSTFGDQQGSTLEDYKEASIMMRFNRTYRVSWTHMYHTCKYIVAKRSLSLTTNAQHAPLDTRTHARTHIK